MAVPIKSTADIAKKWAEVTPGRATYYTAGVTGAGGAWEAGSKGAVANFKAAVTAGNIGQMWAGGIARAGAAKYEAMAKGKGSDRFSSGVTAGAPYFASGFEPFAAAIAGATLPVRQPRGNPANMQRSSTMAAILTAKRLALRSAGV